MTQAVTYKFIGSKFYVGTGLSGVSPTPAITGIALTNPALVTAPAHGNLSAGAVKIAGVVGATQFNNHIYFVDDATTNDLTLAGEDNTQGDAYVSGGRLDTIAFSQSCQITGVNKQGGGADQHDVSSICDEDFKRFVQGLSDTGTLALDYWFAPGTAFQTAMDAAEASGEQLAFKLVAPSSAWSLGLIGTVQVTNWSGSVGDPVFKGSATIKLSGPVFVL